MASGSEIARDAANIVLVDDSFATIVDGIKEGRQIFENLKKAMSYAITTTMPELVPFLIFVICGYPNTLNAIVIILIDLCTSIWPTFALGYEKGEADLMERPPRTIHDRFFSVNLAIHAYLIIGLIQTASEFAMFTICV